MNVVLVSGPTSYRALPPSPSLALATLSSCVRKKGCECFCIDCNFLPGFDFEKLKAGSTEYEIALLEECFSLVLDCDPDVVGISAWNSSLPFAIVLSKALRQAHPEVKIVVGGLRDQFLAIALMRGAPWVDAVVVGDGEIALAEILNRVRRKRDLQGITGVTYRSDDSLYSESPVRSIPVRQWGQPDYTSFVHPIGNYYHLEGSRGCSYRCVFCSLNNQPLQRKRPEILAARLHDLAVTVNAEMVVLTDSFLPMAGPWIDRFCDAVIGNGTCVEWMCCVRADNVSPVTARKLARSGCTKVLLGIESISSDTLSYIDKAQSARQYLENLLTNMNMMLDCGLSLQVSTVIGFPFEGAGDMLRTVDFVLKLQDRGIDASASPVVAFPGSRLWSRYAAGEIGLCGIASPKLKNFRRSYMGPFSRDFMDDPMIVPGNFLPRHKFLRQDELESLLVHGLDMVAPYFRER